MPRPISIPVPALEGRRVLITGASDGIGFHIAHRLARAGAEARRVWELSERLTSVPLAA